MKNIRNKVLSAILAISGLMMVGITTVKAANTNAFTLLNSDVVCEPNKLEKGDMATCYLIGKPDGEDGASVHGYVVNAYTTKYLKLENTKKVVATNTGHVFSTAQSGTDTIKASADMPEDLKLFSCQNDPTIKTDEELSSFGCGIFYTVAGAQTNAFTPETVKGAGAGLGTEVLPDSTYGAIGAFYVKLDDKVQGNECGEICVKVWRVPDADLYSNSKYTACSNADGCGSDTGNVYDCKEVHYNAPIIEPEETGAFASYALLIAGALIAVSAITLAKKNNKFSRI